MNLMNDLDVSKTLSVSELKRVAVQMRKDILYMIYEAQAGHPGGSLSAADILAALYFRVMRIDPANPQWEDRDRFIYPRGTPARSGMLRLPIADIMIVRISALCGN